MVFVLSLAIITLYVIPLISDVAAEGIFGVTLLHTIAAGISTIAAAVLYFVGPKDPAFWPSFIVYALFALTVGFLAYQTGGIESPFIALWMLVSLFASVFGVMSWLPLLIANASYVATAYLFYDLTAASAAMLVFISIVPLIAGIFAWRGKQESTPQGMEAKRLVNQISEVTNKAEVIINAIGDGVIAIDSQGIIQLINPAAQQILGWGRQDALQLNYKSVLKLINDENNEVTDAQSPVAQALNTNQQIRSNNLTLVTKSNNKLQVSLVASPIGEAGSGIIIVFRDISKEKAEEREQAEFISTAAHEMRTPVASIEGYLGLALNPNTATIDEKAREFIMKAHESAQHLGRLFQDLLDISKSEDGRMTSLPKVADMTKLTENVVQNFIPKANEKGLKLIYAPTLHASRQNLAPVYLVHLDNDHVREVLDNLIENAIKYTPKGNVTIDVNGDNEWVTVSVKDTGLGIPAEDLPHLFQKFYRVDKMDRQEIGGTGLGLYLSRRLAESMGGRIWAESVYGQGSVFHFELPRITSQEAQEIQTKQEGHLAIGPPQVPPATPNPNTAIDPPTTPSAPAVAPPAAEPRVAPKSPPSVKPATTVPRGESLTREQKAEHIRRLQSLARSQQTPGRPEETRQ